MSGEDVNDTAHDSTADPGLLDPTRRLYGRRKGRPLRKRKADLYETVLPRLTVALPEEGGTFDPTAAFDRPVDDVWLEVGFGSGHHLAWQAAHHREVGIIGCEPFINGIAALMAMVEEENLDNVRVHPDDARQLLDTLPDASIGRAFVLFADPWPKKRHWNRRFIGPENLARLSRVLKDGAELRLASDDMGLLRWMLEHTLEHPDFTWTARRADDWRVRHADWPATRYEEKALEAGRKPIFLTFKRNART